MRILFIVPYTPNLIRVRPYNLIRYLSERGNQITVLTLWSSEAERADAKALEAYCHQVIALPLSRWRSFWNCLVSLPSGEPLQAAYCWQPALAQAIETLTGAAIDTPDFDVIHVEHLRGVRYGLAYGQQIQRLNGRRIPVVWDSVDCISYLFQQAAAQSASHLGRLMTRLELGRTARYEKRLLAQFDQVLVTSAKDRQAFLALLTDNEYAAPITVVPNGVDLEYFQPDESAVREPATVVISGKMSYHANISMVLHFVSSIMPLIWEQRPDAKLVVAGKDPVREIRELGKIAAVTVTGTVPDLRPYLRHATLAVSPITYGAGVQNKVLEAMACATPIVATPQAVSALQLLPGRDLLVASNPPSFADAVLTLLNSPEKRTQLGHAARRYVEQHHHWATVTGELEKIYRSLNHRFKQ